MTFDLFINQQNIIEKQQDLYRLSTIALEAYAMTCTLSRASHSLCHGIRNNDIEKEAVLASTMESFLKVSQLVEEILADSETCNDQRNQMIHKRNLKFDGYFAMPTIDRII